MYTILLCVVTVSAVTTLIWNIICSIVRGKVASWEPSQSNITHTNIDDDDDGMVIITGGNRGIGLEVVKQLVQIIHQRRQQHLGQKLHIAIACRNVSNCQQVLKKEGLVDMDHTIIEVLYIDLSNFHTIHEFVKQIKLKRKPVYCLVNNAHLSGLSKCHITPQDGNETTFQTNYLGHFLLAQLLLPIMLTSEKQPNSESEQDRLRRHSQSSRRIINVTSRLYQQAKASTLRTKYNRTNRGIDGYNPYLVYQDTKLMQLMFSIEFNRRMKVRMMSKTKKNGAQEEDRNVDVRPSPLPPVISFAVHPGGMIDTRPPIRGSEYNWMFRFVEPTIQYLFGTPLSKGASSIVKLVVSDIHDLIQEQQELIDRTSKIRRKASATTATTAATTTTTDPANDNSRFLLNESEFCTSLYYNTTEPEVLLPHAKYLDDLIWLWNESCHICQVEQGLL